MRFEVSGSPSFVLDPLLWCSLSASKKWLEFGRPSLNSATISTSKIISPGGENFCAPLGNQSNNGWRDFIGKLGFFMLHYLQHQ